MKKRISLRVVALASFIAFPLSAKAIPITSEWTTWVDVMSPGDFYTGTGTGSPTLAGATTIDFVVAPGDTLTVWITDLKPPKPDN